MGLLGMLTIIFVVLKIVGFIAWSWWAVFIPVYVAVGIYIIGLMLMSFGFVKVNKAIRGEFKSVKW